MSSLAGRTIATVGSGVMAEAIIAGLLRGKLVEPPQIVSSHPRADRRDALSSRHGVRTVETNTAAVELWQCTSIVTPLGQRARSAFSNASAIFSGF